MSEQAFNWDEVRRIADQLALEIHLGTMEARDRWHALQPRLLEIERSIANAGKRAGEVVDREIESVSVALRHLRDDLKKKPTVS